MPSLAPCPRRPFVVLPTWFCARSATTLDVSRPEERSLAITACRLAESPIATRLSRRLRRFRFLHHRSDSHRLERSSCRVGVTPTEDQYLTRITVHTKADTAKRHYLTSAPLSRDRLDLRAAYASVGEIADRLHTERRNGAGTQPKGKRSQAKIFRQRVSGDGQPWASERNRITAKEVLAHDLRLPIKNPLAGPPIATRSSLPTISFGV